MPRGVYDSTKTHHQLGVVVTDKTYSALKTESARCGTGPWASFFDLVAEHGLRYDPVCDREGHDTLTLRSRDRKAFTICARCDLVLDTVDVK